MNLETIIKDNVWEKETLVYWLEKVLYLKPLIRNGFSVNKIQLIRATLPSEFYKDIKKRPNPPLEIIKGHVYYNDGKIIKPVSNGLSRENEYKIQVSLLNELNKSNLKLEMIGEDRSYDKIIDDWYKRVNKKSKEINNLVFQGARNFAHILNENVNNDPYLPFFYKNKTLFIEWTRGAQIGKIAKKLISEENIQRCFLYGACGLFNEEGEINDLIIPSCTMIEDKTKKIVFDNIFEQYELKNNLGNVYHGGMLNVYSPYIETNRLLKNALSKGLLGVEMELYWLVNEIKKSKKNIEIGGVYYCSDTPLKNNKVHFDSPHKNAILYSILKLLD